MNFKKFTLFIAGFSCLAYSNFNSKMDLSCGAGVLYIANCNIGILFSKNIGVEINGGSSAIINNTALYIDYARVNKTGVVKYGVGPNYNVSCWEDDCYGKVGLGLHRKSIKMNLSSKSKGWYYDLGLNVIKTAGRYIPIPRISIGFSLLFL